MITPQGATKSCSLWVRFRPNCARSFWWPVNGKSLAVWAGMVCPSAVRLKWTSPFWSTGSRSGSSISGSFEAASTTLTGTCEFISGRGSLGCANCARLSRSFSWKRDWPWTSCILSACWCSTRLQTLLPEVTGFLQPTTAQIASSEVWTGQNRSQLLLNGTLQWAIPQHGWPMQTPSITTTDTFRFNSVRKIMSESTTKWDHVL